jgi:hypothetical protein
MNLTKSEMRLTRMARKVRRDKLGLNSTGYYQHDLYVLKISDGFNRKSYFPVVGSSFGSRLGNTVKDAEKELLNY